MTKKLNGLLTNRTMSQHNDSIKCTARYLINKGGKRTSAECFHNMTFKSGRLYRSSARATSLRKLESRIRRHPVIKCHDTKPRTYSCTVEVYEQYFEDDPFYVWTDKDSVNRRPRNG